jgi:anthranilate/para-aminobenzoate synthase component II
MHLLIVNNSDSEVDYSPLEVYGVVTYISHTDLANADFDKLLADKTALLFTGGRQHVYEMEKYPEIYHELFLTEAAIQRGIKIIGICLGFQIINHYFGNKVVRLSEPCIGHGFLDSGSFKHHGDARLQNMDLRLLCDSLSFHYDAVLTNTNPDLYVVGRSNPLPEAPEGVVYFVKHRFLPIYAIQSHPDTGHDMTAACLKKYGAVCKEPLHSKHKYDAIWANFFQLLA